MPRRPQGDGSVYQRSRDGLWCVVVELPRVGGKRRRRTVTGTTRQEARRRAQEALSDFRSYDPTMMGSWLLARLRALEGVVSPSSHAAYAKVVHKALVPHLGSLTLAALTEAHVRAMYAAVSPARGLAAGKLLRRFLRDAVRAGLVARNVAMDLPLPRVVRRRVQPLSAADAANLIALPRVGAAQCLYAVALDSGAREGELLALEWGDLHPDGSLLISKSLCEVGGSLTVVEPKTKGSRRRIALGAATLARLARHRLLQQDAGYGGPLIFPSPRGVYWHKGSLYSRHWQPDREAAGLPTTTRFHDLRHTTASLLLLAGIHPKVVQERLGHSAISITLDTYSHLIPTMQADAATRLDTLLR